MRLTTCGIMFVLLVTAISSRIDAQIPEKTMFQPGSYAAGAYQTGRSMITPSMTVLVEVPDETGMIDSDDTESEDDQSDWQTYFGSQPPKTSGTTKFVEMSVAAEGFAMTTSHGSVPYLAWHRSPFTGRTHIIPYQPGYAAAPEQFPQQQSKMNLWLSSLPSREKSQPQVKYLGYYDPMPEVVTDKPSRIDLILGYGGPNWSTTCQNKWGYSLAQCPGVEPYKPPCFAEMNVKNQYIGPEMPPRFMGGIFAGPRPIMPQYQMGTYSQQQCPCQECLQEPRQIALPPVVSNPPVCQYATSSKCGSQKCSSQCSSQNSCSASNPCKSCFSQKGRRNTACAPPKARYSIKKVVVNDASENAAE
ncbi:MAG: hypothetical protein ACRCUY_11240 [Thermoguttaceae bacterium]